MLNLSHTHTPAHTNTHTPRPLAALHSGDWREQECRSRWAGPLVVWVGEVSDRTWQMSWRPAVSSQTGSGWGSMGLRRRYLHGACLPAAYHGRPAVDVDWLRDRKRLVRLVLGQILQAALIGLLVLILIGLKNRKRGEELINSSMQHSYWPGGGTTATISINSIQVDDKLGRTSEEAGRKPEPRGAFSSSSQPLTPGLKWSSTWKRSSEVGSCTHTDRHVGTA